MKEWSSDLSCVEVGDWICTFRVGWDRVASLLSGTSILYPILTESGITYTIDGKRRKTDRVPTAFSEPPEWLIDIVGPRPCDFKKWDRVLVRDSSGNTWIRRYFSHVGDDGRLYCFNDGQDEWTSDGAVTPWKYCKKHRDQTSNKFNELCGDCKS